MIGDNQRTVFQIYDDELQFLTTQDIVKTKLFDICQVDIIDSYSISLWFKLKNSSAQNQDLDFFQIGQSTAYKMLRIGISKNKEIFVYFMNIKNKQEYLFSQIKIKPNKFYHMVLTVKVGLTFRDISLYVNSQIESMISLTMPLEHLDGTIYLGSEVASKLFQGSLKDLIFFTKALDQSEIQRIYDIKNQKQQQQIIKTNEVLAKYQQEQDFNQTISKQKGVPLSLVQSFYKNTDYYNLNQSKDDINIDSKEGIQLTATAQVIDYLNENDSFRERMFDIISNFEWIFIISQLIAPPVEDSKSKFDYDCITNYLASCYYDKLPYNLKQEYSPFYFISFNKFYKILQYLAVPVSETELIELGSCANSFYICKKYGKLIQYDRLLLAVRNALMNEDDILNMRKNYKNNPFVEPEVLEPIQVQEQVQEVISDYDFKPAFVCYYLNDEDVEYKPIQSLNFEEQSINCRPISIIFVSSKQDCRPLILEFKYLNYQLNQMYVKSYAFEKDIVENDKEMQQVNFGENELIQNMAVFFNAQNQMVKLELIGSQTYSLFFGKDTQLDIFHKEIIRCASDEFFTGFETRLISFHSQNDDGTFSEVKQLSGWGAFINTKLNMQKNTYIPPQEEKIPEKKVEEEKPIITYEQMPQVNDDWCGGKFQIIINYCHNCIKHKNTSIHEEADFAEKCNSLADSLREIFPRIEIQANYDPPYNQIEYFQVYIRGIFKNKKGVGPIEQRDKYFRHFLYQKNCSFSKFITEQSQLEMLQIIYENLVILQSAYNGTEAMGEEQDKFLFNYQNQIPIPGTNIQDIPVSYPLRKHEEKKIKESQMKIPNGTKMMCRNWTCNKQFQFLEKPDKTQNVCRYHPGQYQFGSKCGYWPASWTCCRKDWESSGCTIGKHQGVTFEKSFNRTCINYGEPNPKSGRPDSACGKYYDETNPSECVYHSGHFYKKTIHDEGIWTCCQDDYYSKGCIFGNHNHAQWPDPQAQLYFVHKSTIDPAKDNIADGIITSGFFYKTKPYQIYQSSHKKRSEYIKQHENDERKCQNWACEQIYKDNNNKERKNCYSHNGVFDFGYTSQKIEQALKKQNTLGQSWKPHWTCCRQEWNAKGCQKTFHSGPLLQNTQDIRQYEWPDEKCLIYFKKQGSDLWKKKLENYIDIDDLAFNQIWQKAFQKLQCMGKIPMSNFPKLCDYYQLHLLVLSEDMNYTFKFIQVMQNQVQDEICTSNDNVDKEKFKQWWFSKVI